MGYRIALRDDPFTVRIGGPRNLSVLLTREVGDPQVPGQSADLLQMLAQVDPPPKAAAALGEMLPLPSDDREYDPAAEGGAATNPSSRLRFDDLPAPLKEFSNTLYLEMADAGVNAFELVRWRQAMLGPIRPYVSQKFEWSEDRVSWSTLPRKIAFRVNPSVRQRLTASDATEIESMISSGHQEPLAHVLLREAKASATVTGSYSSALIIAMAALEIGAKRLIADLVPNAEWLALNVPSPPIVSILTDYLPALPARLRFDGSVLAPPDELIKLIRKGVTRRNAAVHAGSPPPSRDFVDRVLDAVSDLLWLFDYYAGNEWALTWMSGSTREALISPSEDRAT